MRKPTRTINRLHFEDLGPRRFDDLVLALVYRSRTWEGIHHDGRMGGDEGVDIRAIEREMDGHWFVRPIAIRRSEPRLPGFHGRSTATWSSS